MFLSLSRRLALPLAFAVLAALPGSLQAQEPADQSTPEEESTAVTETIQVTATRVPEDVEGVPASVTVITGDELRARGVTDLPGALGVVAGVSVAPGGDNGPAGSVPEIWGLREFDAFLLVVDDVPWGGAFNPALTALDLTNVERIEILRGAAPVLYGATSFVGVIHVIHRAAGTPGRTVRLWGGSYESGGAAVSLPLSTSGRFQQSLTVDAERQGFKDDRTGYDRGHILYRGLLPTANGTFRVDVDGNVLRQDPASPHVRQGRVLSPLIPLDANYNPKNAEIDENRWHLTTGYDRKLGGGSWSTTLGLTHSDRDTLRGFLTSVSNQAPNARGYDQELSLDDLYFDTHVVAHPNSNVQVVAGFDHLYGRGEAEARDFDYFVPINGRTAPSVSGFPRRNQFEMEDERNFSGLYLQTEWTPTHRLRFQVGARLNHTVEEREAGEEPLSGEEPGEEEEEEGQDKRTVTRGSGTVGVSFLAWERNDNALWLFADWRDSYKPAALDFGPEAEPEILEPETAQSWEVGLKGHQLGGRLDWEITGFRMDFENLVVAQTRNGLPTLINAGSERFEGAEVEASFHVLDDLLWRAVYSRHDAKFREYSQAFDGVLTRLDGNRLEMSAKDLAGSELVWSPDHGVNGSLQVQYVGDRFLNKRNTALAQSYTTWSAGIGYSFSRWDLRLQGDNLSDERPPVAESELGDAQYYRLPARNVRLIWSSRF